MVKRLTLIVSFFCFTVFLNAQDSIRVNTFLEVGGNGGIASVNFDKPVIIFKKSFISLRAGFGFSREIMGDLETQNFVMIPTMIHYCIGKSPHYLETGFGLALGISAHSGIISRITPTIGYRFQKSEVSGMFFRINYTPLLPSGFGDKFKQWMGISIGYTFKSKQ